MINRNADRKMKAPRRHCLAAALMFAFAASLLALPTSASAGEFLQLKSKIIVEDDVVTLGDIFEGAGKNRATPLFKSPALGREGAIRIEKLIGIATRFGFTFDTPLSAKTITVSRPARTITPEAVKALITKELRRQLKIEEGDIIELTFDKMLDPFYIPLSHTGEMNLSRFNRRPGTTSFSAIIAPGDAISAAYNKSLSGSYQIKTAHPVLTREVKRGETISASDLIMKATATGRLPKATLMKEADIIGKTATKTLRAESPLRAGDLEQPKLIKKNQLVTLVFEKRGMTLKTRGKAMADGGLKESIQVMNIQSKRMVEGTIISAGVILIHNTEVTETYRQTAQLTDR